MLWRGPVVGAFSEAGKFMGETPEEWLGPYLMGKEWHLATAESCTGGLIAHRITNVPGSSNFFECGFITYSNDAKAEHLGVPEKILIEHGAVSEPCARAMADGVRKTANCELGLSVTGIAGPGGGVPGKPVGTVYMAVSHPSGLICRHFVFEGGRQEVKEQTAEAALTMLREAILGEKG